MRKTLYVRMHFVKKHLRETPKLRHNGLIIAALGLRMDAVSDSLHTVPERDVLIRRPTGIRETAIELRGGADQLRKRKCRSTSENRKYPR
jgi:hypothetical protein